MNTGRTCLVVIDMIHADAHPDYTFARQLQEANIDASYYWERIEHQLLPNISALLRQFRSAGNKIIYTESSAYFEDFSDSGNNLRDLYRSWNATQSQADAHVRAELAPERGDAVLVKPSSGAWTSTPIDYMLRSARIEHVVICGVVTNGCIIATAIGAWDHGYTVTVVDDACATLTDTMHQGALDILRFLQMEVTLTAEVLSRLDVAGTAELPGTADVAPISELPTTLPVKQAFSNWAASL